jgi:DNA helicase-2/ATP-dependent DNA helicase PcrA
VLEHALFNAAVAYRVYGGLRFFERQEIKHALAYLRLVVNGDDDNALLRVINFPTRGIGARSLEQLQTLSQGRGVSLWAAACANTLGGKAGASIAALITLIEKMREAAHGLTLPEIIEHVVEMSGLRTHYQTEKEGQDRLDNLAELVTAAANFVTERDVIVFTTDGGEAVLDAQARGDVLADFLAHAALEAGEHQAGAGSDALQLMTVHSAKGLEFHTVFISGLEEGLFPHENSAKEADGLEEERRLMYVALTRARRRLYLSLAQSRMLHGQTRYNHASNFFLEIPEKLIRRMNARPRYSGANRTAGGLGLVEAPRASYQDPALPWRVGQSVLHPKFGAGVIVNAEGRGAEARVQVNFREEGLKWLMLQYAKLAAA